LLPNHASGVGSEIESVVTSPHPGVVAVRRLLVEWTASRIVLAELEAAEHPPIVDRFGREWVWGGRGDSYSHDRTLAVPKAWILEQGLPPAALADNWNYYRLCTVCTSTWPAVALKQHAQNAVDQADYARLGWDGLQELRRQREQQEHP
jgi:hypothetical protein